jgi:lipoprotein-anchoring transpeptidase ErfK/SrfK
MIVPDSYLHISIAKQQLSVVSNKDVDKVYSVSTAKNGAGEKMGSECTPTGWHKVRVKIGDSYPLNSVFVGRRATGEIYSPQLGLEYPERDWVLTRIFWLGGLESRKNRYGQVDSTWRYIYIHGCPDELMLGKPGSHGCIRMKNKEIGDLFDRVDVGFKVLIE